MSETPARRDRSTGVGALRCALLAGLFVLGPGCPEGSPGPDAGKPLDPAGQLIFRRGDVQLERAGKSGAAELGYVYVGDALQTGADSEARVRFPGGRVIEVGSNGRFLIESGEGGIVLRVEQGLLLSRIPADAAVVPGEATVALSILTPFGLTRIGTANSELSIDVAKDSAKLTVKVGSVQFVRDGKVTEAGEGASLSATASGVDVGGGPTMELKPVKVTIFASAGRAEIKRKDSKKWQAVGRKGDSLAQGDAIRVRDGRSLVQLEGSATQWTLLRGTEAVLTEAQASGNSDEAGLDLKKGELSVQLAPGRKTRLLTAGLELGNDGGGQFNLVRNGEDYELWATAGDLRVKAGGQEQVVRAGDVARVGSKGVAVEAQTREVVTLPSRGGTRVYHSGLSRLTLGWDGPDQDYRVEVAADPAFKNVLVEGTVHKAHVNVPAPGRGVLFWKVATTDGKEVDRGSAAFSPEPRVGELGNLRNEVPEGSETTTIFYQDKPPAVTFTYKPEEGAVKYRVVVYRADALDKPLVEREEKDERLALEAGVLLEGKYVWSVTPVSDKGEELRGGKMSKLEMVYDNALPNLVIKSPKNGDPARNPTTVAGVAPLGARVYVNGRQVPLDDKARFEATTTPVGRPPVVIFRMVQPSGPEFITVRTLRRGR